MTGNSVRNVFCHNPIILNLVKPRLFYGDYAKKVSTESNTKQKQKSTYLIF